MKTKKSVLYPLLLGGGLMMLSLQTLAAQYVSGENKTQLVELYTSEGCSSCPPADEYLSKLKDDDALWKTYIPVAFHVDYWNYIGWEDRFARKDFSERQRGYRAQGNISQVYTPGFVVDGKEWRGFFAREQLPEMTPESAGTLQADVQDNKVSVTFTPDEILLSQLNAGESEKPLMVNVAILGFDLVTNVKAGENRGVDLHHDFTVIGFKQTELMPGEAANFIGSTALPDSKVSAPKKGIAIWVSEKDKNAPVQAVGGWL